MCAIPKNFLNIIFNELLNVGKASFYCAQTVQMLTRDFLDSIRFETATKLKPTSTHHPHQPHQPHQPTVHIVPSTSSNWLTNKFSQFRSHHFPFVHQFTSLTSTNNTFQFKLTRFTLQFRISKLRNHTTKPKITSYINRQL